MNMPDKGNTQPPANIVRTADLMPDSPTDTRILADRARRYSVHVNEEADQSGQIRYIRFRLGNELFGIPYQYAIEVVHSIQLTPMPSVPGFVSGIINHRGSLLAIIDMKHFFPVEPAAYADASIIIVKNQNITVGILADGISGSDTYSEKTLDAAIPSETAKKPDYILGLHDGRTAVLNMDRILTDPSIQIKKES